MATEIDALYMGINNIATPIEFGAAPVLQSKAVDPSTSQQTVSPDSGYDALSQVVVNAIQTQTKSATPSTSAQTITPDSGKFLSSVSVGAIQTQTKSVTPSTSSQTVYPDSGKYLSSVTVGAVPDLIMYWGVFPGGSTKRCYISECVYLTVIIPYDWPAVSAMYEDGTGLTTNSYRITSDYNALYVRKCTGTAGHGRIILSSSSNVPFVAIASLSNTSSVHITSFVD